MKLLVDAHIFDDKQQGSRTYLKNIYTALIPRFLECHFYIVGNNLEILKNEFGSHANVTLLQYKSKNKYVRLIKEIPSLTRKLDIDLSHFQYTCPPFLKGKVIVTNHDALFKEKRFKSFFPLKYILINAMLHQFSAKKADKVLTVSKYSEQKLMEFYKIPKNKIDVTPNAVNEDYIHFKDTLPEELNNQKYILYTSRIEPRKNHHRLVKAFFELNLHLKGFKLVFVGMKDIHYPELDQLLNHDYKAECEQYLKHFVNISLNELKSIYKHCEVFVFPSIAEGFGIPPLEALMLDAKILCSNTTAMKDFNFPNACSFNPFDIIELKQKLQWLIENENPIDPKMKNEIVNNFSWERSADILKKTILELTYDKA